MQDAIRAAGANSFPQNLKRKSRGPGSLFCARQSLVTLPLRSQECMTDFRHAEAAELFSSQRRCASGGMTG